MIGLILRKEPKRNTTKKSIANLQRAGQGNASGAWWRGCHSLIVVFEFVKYVLSIYTVHMEGIDMSSIEILLFRGCSLYFFQYTARGGSQFTGSNLIHESYTNNAPIIDYYEYSPNIHYRVTKTHRIP